MSNDQNEGNDPRWAHLRFAVVGRLLAAPPPKGELRRELERLSAMEWQHPATGQPVQFGLSTIERWYYSARAAANPVTVLGRKLREDRGQFTAISGELAAVIRRQYEQHPSWSYQLHRDNLTAEVESRPELGPAPSYATLHRYMVAQQLVRQPRRRRDERSGELRARTQRSAREVRSYESEYTNALWHLDFHHASLKVLRPDGGWVRPILLGILDDRSRLVCHAQWYLDETAESLVHGLTQALLKRGLPRALMTDNGAAMMARETTEGLARLSILHQTTLPYSPHQNGKQESFWSPVEGRLLAMLEGQPDLSLALLNQATQAWIEREYNQLRHSETGQTPLDRWLDGPSVARDTPTLDDLRYAFTTVATRAQRRSDGTISLDGVRFEIPSRFRTLPRVALRYASWDLTRVWVADPRTGKALTRIVPLDKNRNADGVRAAVSPEAPPSTTPAPSSGMAPLLRKLMSEYAATGLPPAYLPKEES